MLNLLIHVLQVLVTILVYTLLMWDAHCQVSNLCTLDSSIKVKVRIGKKSFTKCAVFKKKKMSIKNRCESTIQDCNNILSEEKANLNLEKIKENLFTLKVSKNNQQSIWKIKNKFLPKNQPTLPVAKRNIDGKIVTNNIELKNIYREHFSYRMRSRPIVPHLENYQIKVENNFQKILKSTGKLSVPDWSMCDLEKVLKTLKSNQSQDTMGLINELFMIKNIGHNLK